MAEGCAVPTLAATDAGLSSRSRSGSSSGSSESDGSPICKISPLVAPVSSSPRPLTPKKRHRAEMEEEARRQEALRATEKEKAESEDKTLTADDKSKEEKELTVKVIPESETETPAEAEATTPSTTPVKSKDTEIEATPTEKDNKRRSTKKRKAEEDVKDPDAAETTPAKRRTTPKKKEVAKTPVPSKSPTKAPKTLSSATVTESGDEPPLPDGWKRMVTQRMQGESAGKFDVYIWSPSGKKFRSRPQLLAYLEKTGSPLSIEDFSFKPPRSKSSATPARIRKSSPVRGKKTTTPTKKKRKTAVVEKATPRKDRPKKNNVAKKSPGKQAAGKAKKGKQQRKVMKPPPDTGSKKASRAQQLQKLLVKINFQKPGDIREMSEEDSSEESSEDDFDPGTTEEAGPDVSDVSLTPSPPKSKKIRRHSSPTV